VETLTNLVTETLAPELDNHLQDQLNSSTQAIGLGDAGKFVTHGATIFALGKGIYEIGKTGVRLGSIADLSSMNTSDMWVATALIVGTFLACRNMYI
jgi:hypothetical protein